MKIVKIVKDIFSAIRDPERDIQERIFLIYTFISVLTAIFAVTGDIIIGDSIEEIVILLGVVIAVPVISITSFYKNRLDIGVTLVVLCLVFVILPGIMFFGGGVESGALIWIIFAYLYVGHVASGFLRKAMITLITLFSIAFFIVEYYFPEYVYHHERHIYYVDTLISLILVGFVCFTMNLFQNRLFREENLRAKKEAERAEELTRAQNRFFSSMSHEIRTPINSILGLNELILRDSSNQEETAHNASGIQGAGKMLLALINDILDFSKMEAGSMDIVPVDYKIGDMLSEIVNMIWLRATDKGLKFDVSVDPSVPSGLYGDEVRIKQVIVNLLNNAVKYTERGSVELHIEGEKISDEHVTLRISVSDTGMGIKKDVIPYLFDAFKRVDEEKNRHIEGTGLGLSIVKQIVDLMGGNVTVNSVYGAGTTFTVTLTQGISDSGEIGEINIHNQEIVGRAKYEASFRAPNARCLIVDDNEMNLEVEAKLLLGTQMPIDKAISGKKALEMALVNHYDVILMDHLMPEMDGITCLEKLRNQVGGLNRTTPVIVLTANAGSENRELYNRSGFDGYLVKPVSGEALENVLMKFIPSDKLIISGKIMSVREDINTLEGFAGKAPVVITCSSMCDIPDSIISRFHLPVIPFLIHTERSTFKDKVQMSADEVINYILSGKKAESSPPSDMEYTEFFAKHLKKAHHLIHISITTSMSDDYKIASEAARAFDNVTVINSGCISSSTGLLVLIAHKLAQQNLPIDEIVSEIESVKQRLRCSFVIETTEYMAKRGLVGSKIDKFSRFINLHPCLNIKNDKVKIGGAWTGNIKKAYKMYIKKAFRGEYLPDPDILFIPYVNVPTETLLWIKKEVSKQANFENIVFVQASAAISSNCGPGSFGLLYFTKSSKSYGLTTFIENEYVEINDSDIEEVDEAFDQYEDKVEGLPARADFEEAKWYYQIPNIDGDIALKNSGSEEGFKAILKIFYESLDAKSQELNNYYDEGDWENYTIKIHALKSSAKLIGAMGVADKAQALEDAGKAENIAYIKDNHEAIMKEFISYKEPLSKIFEEGLEDEAKKKPLADDFLLECVYEELKAASEDMDYVRIDNAMKEIEDYAIPESHKEKFETLKDMAEKLNYEGILEFLKE